MMKCLIIFVCLGFVIFTPLSRANELSYEPKFTRVPASTWFSLFKLEDSAENYQELAAGFTNNGGHFYGRGEVCFIQLSKPFSLLAAICFYHERSTNNFKVRLVDARYPILLSIHPSVENEEQYILRELSSDEFSCNVAKPLLKGASLVKESCTVSVSDPETMKMIIAERYLTNDSFFHFSFHSYKEGTLPVAYSRFLVGNMKAKKYPFPVGVQFLSQHPQLLN